MKQNTHWKHTDRNRSTTTTSNSDISEKEIKDEISDELLKQENIHVEILEKTKEEVGIHDGDEIKELVSKTLQKVK